MCRRIKIEKDETSMFLLTSESARFVMNQEWYCTSNAIAQIMIIFISSIYDELKT